MTDPWQREADRDRPRGYRPKRRRRFKVPEWVGTAVAALALMALTVLTYHLGFERITRCK